MQRRFSRRLRHEALESRQLLHGGGVGAAGEPVDDFALADVNPTSPTFGQNVSPSQYSGTTAWYFIHST